MSITVDVELPDTVNVFPASGLYAYTADQVRQVVAAALAKQAGQSEAVAMVRTKGTVRAFPLDAAYELPDGDYKCYTTPQPSPVAQPVQDVVPGAVLKAIGAAGFSLLKTQRGYQLMALGKIEAQSAPLVQPVNAELVEALQGLLHEYQLHANHAYCQVGCEEDVIAKANFALSRTQAAQPQQREKLNEQ